MLQSLLRSRSRLGPKMLRSSIEGDGYHCRRCPYHRNPRSPCHTSRLSRPSWGRHRRKRCPWRRSTNCRTPSWSHHRTRSTLCSRRSPRHRIGRTIPLCTLRSHRNTCRWRHCPRLCTWYWRVMVPLQESRPKVIRLVVTETVAGVGAVTGVRATVAVAAGVRATAAEGVRATAALDRRRTRSTWCLRRSRRRHRRRTISGQCTRSMHSCRDRWPHCPG